MTDRNPGWKMRRARDLAASHELEGVDFLDAGFTIGAKGAAVAHVRLKFYGERPLTMTVREFSMLKEVEFKLRPKDQQSG